jgi:hypothetical protein
MCDQAAWKRLALPAITVDLMSRKVTHCLSATELIDYGSQVPREENLLPKARTLSLFSTYLSF